MRIYFEVLGKPVGKQRPRTVRNKYSGKVHTFTPDKTKSYEAEVAKAYMKSASRNQFAVKFDSAVGVSIFVFVKCPKKQTYSSPTVKPDIDNIAKTILDALNGVAYEDDKQVTYLSISKIYGNEDIVFVSVYDYE